MAKDTTRRRAGAPATPNRRAAARALMLGAAGAAALPAALRPARAQARGRVAIVGAGPAGATLANRLAEIAPETEVTLISARAVVTTGSFSNLYLAGYRSLRSLSFDVRRLAGARANLSVVIDQVTAIDRSARQLRLAATPALPYDRLALAPGVAFRGSAIEGYDAAAAETMPHAMAGGFQSHLLRARLRAMRPGGVLALTAPPPAARCPLAPYERASLAARLFQRVNPRAKILLFDAKEVFPEQALFEAAWAEAYGDMIEWVAASASGGGVARVDPRAGSVTLGDGRSLQVDAASIVPPQRAATLLETAGLTDGSGWAPVRPETMRSALDENVFVLGDAARMDPAPKLASAAQAGAEIAAAAIASDLLGAPPPNPAPFEAPLWSFVDAAGAIASGGVFEIAGGDVRETRALSSPRGIDARARQDNGLAANAWYSSMTRAAYGA